VCNKGHSRHKHENVQKKEITDNKSYGQTLEISQADNAAKKFNSSEGTVRSMNGRNQLP
jgi:hypothetical protein